MNNILTIFRRESAAYFNSAVATIFATVFVLLNGSLFMMQFFLIGRADMRPFFTLLPFLLAVFIPAVTMRLWAEERRGNTLEMLLTFPMGTQELVLGKFLAALLFYAAALAGTLSIPVMLFALGRPDAGVLAGGYAGALFMGAFFLAVGLFVSGLVRDQITAFIVSMLICFTLYFAGTDFVAASLDGWVTGAGTLVRLFLGTARHYDAFARGVIDLRDVIYFLLGTALFLVLNGFWLEGRMRPKAGTIFTGAVALSAGIFFLGNWFVSGVSIGRFDFTEGRIYTVSQASKDIIRALKAPVTVKFYISPADKLPAGMKTLEQDVAGKLEEFRLASRGRLQYKILHMEAVQAVEAAAKGRTDTLEAELSKKGVEPFQVQSIEADEVGVKLVYSALSISYKEKPEEVLPRIMPESLDELEYMIVSKIYRLTLDAKPKVAIVAPYEDRNVDPQMQALLMQLTGQAGPQGYREDQYELLPALLNYEGYDVTRIQLSENEPIPEKTKTLIVVEPGHFSERQRFEISRFLASGGSLFLAAQNYEFEYKPARRSLTLFPNEKSPDVNPLLENWGLSLNPDILLDQQHDVISMSGAAQSGIFNIPIPVKLPIQIVIPPAGMNTEVSMTSHLSSLFYLWGSALTVDKNKLQAEGLKLTTLLESSRNSWTIPFKPGPMSAEELLESEPGSKGPYPLAVMAEGTFKDAFAGKPAPAWVSKQPDSAEKEPEEQPEAVMSAPGKLILTGAVTMFQKQLAQGGGHLNFFLNAVDALTLGDQLVKIRSKRVTDRAIGRISTGAKLAWRLFVTLLIPVLIALAGTLNLMMRGRAKQAYLKVSQAG
ncbi:MAG: hypothetical protein A2Y02_00550 [Omnitrophica bacterium GWA2_52_12]|nr:MAG: hypothetical protein A2Y02_00550 [Omnitrophica bacterium GWA2_52_12]